MIKGIGIDICEVSRIKKAILRSESFILKIFTKTEIAYCEQKKLGKYASYAARFAAKEAFSKALGCGIGKSFAFHDIQVENNLAGKPTIIILNPNLTKQLNNTTIFLTLTHSENYAVANIILEKQG